MSPMQASSVYGIWWYSVCTKCVVMMCTEFVAMDRLSCVQLHKHLYVMLSVYY